jgi:N-acetylmuramoyl-L-alanine amidase
MKRSTAFATVTALAAAIVSLAQTAHPGQHNVTAVRHWNAAGVTRFAIEVSGEFEYRSDRLHDPERVYYDILNSRPKFENKRLFTEDVDDPFVKRIRVAETAPDVTRVVLDLTGQVQVNASIMSSPDRLIVELRRGETATTNQAASISPVTLNPPPPAPVAVAPPPVAPPPVAIAPLPVATEPVSAERPSPESPATQAASISPATAPATIPKAARRTSTGETSLVRALGLKLQRIVIDPGHGGHDEGTQGPKGLLEKDLVLDVSLRLGKLIEQKMGAEVIYTRSDDTFIPLEGRTALANDKKADLFLSIHANSSPVPRITGVETYYLNFTGARDSMEVASRENAGSDQSIFELRDLIQKISAHDKASESRDFAERIQSTLFAFSVKTFTAEKNRGIKTAPFIVLIGANMPSVLAEIGFVSNPREEALLKKPEYRQKLAEALYRGVSKYAESLSHFQMAAN